MLHRVEWSVMVHHLRTPAPRAWEVGTKDWEWGVTSCGVPQSQLSWSSGSKSIHLTTGRRKRNGVSPVIAMNKNVTFSSGHNNILFHELKCNYQQSCSLLYNERVKWTIIIVWVRLNLLSWRFIIKQMTFHTVSVTLTFHTFWKMTLTFHTCPVKWH